MSKKQHQKNKWQKTPKIHKVDYTFNKTTGTISISAKGTGYVKVEGQKEDIEIDFRHLRTALHGDTVEVVLHKGWQ